MEEFNSKDLDRYEIMKEIHPVAVELKCPNCGNGTLEPSTDPQIQMMDVTTLDSRMISHICKSCGIVLRLPRQYPYVRFLTDSEYEEFKKSKKVGDTNGANEIPVGTEESES